ncbi:hypothetical protein XPR_1390 [Xanthomonas arboricola pv. pruni MAFF 301420]|uniref:Transmembrane protein n=1 Tax=Xanthomonas arboricola pv. pruni MAFF 301420 TaxID=1418095 RepID=W4SDS4_9XANT|nr:hypothetical protein XPR_1390 [Xanthomonas arboricola pv. pruni MAFF 301420]GAE59316.1 hypothetical protein XPN_1222 [Xanthomonas arboricola pv. pruni MAFF 301427]
MHGDVSLDRFHPALSRRHRAAGTAYGCQRPRCPAPVADVLLLDFRCGRTGTRNRDIWSELPDIRSARQARRLQHWAKSGVLFTAAAVVFALAVGSYLMH